MSKYRTSNSSNFTKYSYRCSQYRKYPLCRYEIQVYVADEDATNIRLILENAHSHEQRNVTTRLHSPVRKSVAKYVECSLTQAVLQIDATYKLTWNELPLLVFGASDVDRHFRPFDVALISSDEGSSCFRDLFNELQCVSTQECKSQYLVHYVMVDGASARTQKETIPQAKRLMCSAHVIRKCREHRKLVPKDRWNQIDVDIHNLQLSFSDIIFNHGALYEDATPNVPSTNNKCESLNRKIKQQYTRRNKFHLLSALPQIESMLHDWTTSSLSNGFSTKPYILTSLELDALQWSNTIGKISILYRFDTWYIVSSSHSLITPIVWLQLYQQQRWASFDEFVI